MTIVKLLACKIILCIHSSLDGNFHIFLSKLQRVIQKLRVRSGAVVCGSVLQAGRCLV